MMAAPNPQEAHHPPRKSLRALMAENPMPQVPPGTVDAAASVAAGDGGPGRLAREALAEFNAALAAGDAAAVRRCLYPAQAHWRDSLALTWHLRTFSTGPVVAAALLETRGLRGVREGFAAAGAATFWPELPMIDCDLTFRTESPAATCSGKVFLLPVRDDENAAVRWKIWCLYTRLEDLEVHPEKEQLLREPGMTLGDGDEFETDVLIIGAGNAAVALAARLKALGVRSVMVERNARVGDNWALRYDCLKFHVPTSYADMPYMPYDDKFRNEMVPRDELASHLRRYAAEFRLAAVTSATARRTRYDVAARRWNVELQTAAGAAKTAVARHLVQATGVGSQRPNQPRLAGEALFRGVAMHSTQYRSPALSLAARGIPPGKATTVLVVGAASTAWDVVGDVHAAGYGAAVAARSPPYVFPIGHVRRAVGGVYDARGPAAGDALTMGMPAFVDAQVSAAGLARLEEGDAAQRERLGRLRRAGFPVVGSADGAVLQASLLERLGGYYVDVCGGEVLRLVADGEVRAKVGVEPVAYTETGVRFSDGSVAEAAAVIWCTGFRDQDVRETVVEVLGGLPSPTPSEEQEAGQTLGPAEVAAGMDSTWGVDGEGEIRGLWKRPRGLEGVNFWVTGGHTQHHRYHSRTLALQIKAELEGLLPPAYRKTPGVV